MNPRVNGRLANLGLVFVDAQAERSARFNRVKKEVLAERGISYRDFNAAVRAGKEIERRMRTWGK